jgi:hypothetical protein
VRRLVPYDLQRHLAGSRVGALEARAEPDVARRRLLDVLRPGKPLRLVARVDDVVEHLLDRPVDVGAAARLDHGGAS